MLVAQTISELLQGKATSMSKVQMADVLGVTPQAVTNWLSGQRTPRLDIGDRLAGLLGIPVSDVIAAITAQKLAVQPMKTPIVRPVSDVEARLAAVEAKVEGVETLAGQFARALDRLESAQRSRKQGARSGR